MVLRTIPAAGGQKGLIAGDIYIYIHIYIGVIGVILGKWKRKWKRLSRV